jgi:hypothetical protein
MMPNRTIALAVIALTVASACKDKGPREIGPPAQLTVVSGNNQSAAANTTVPAPIVVQVQDADGDPVGDGQTVTFSVVGGGGITIGTATLTTDANGNVTAPTWQLGKSNLPQIMRASLGGITTDVTATIQTQYDIVVRFYGSPLPTAAQQAFFLNAAARIEGMITGDITNAQTSGTDLSAPDACDEPGLPTVTEQVDDIIIYASIAPIDGPSNILGQATPCLARHHPQPNGPQMVAYGYMKFDAADFPGFQNPQEVIIHEMLHVLGSGTLWETDRTLISGKGGSDPRFLGPLARDACVALGGPITCATSVPLENTGGIGTRDFHWREATFNNELMTGFYNTGLNPLSTMTIASMADLGFVVNNADFDTYNFAGPMVLPSIQAGGLSQRWEQIGRVRGTLLPNGRVEAIKYK